MIKIKGIKKILFSATALTTILSPLSVLAAAVPLPAAPNNVPTDITIVLDSIITGVIAIIALIAVLFVVWGGVQYLTAAGDEAQVEKAKNTISYALMGLVIAAIAYAAVTLIVGWLVG